MQKKNVRIKRQLILKKTSGPKTTGKVVAEQIQQYTDLRSQTSLLASPNLLIFRCNFRIFMSLSSEACNLTFKTKSKNSMFLKLKLGALAKKIRKNSNIEQYHSSIINSPKVFTYFILRKNSAFSVSFLAAYSSRNAK